MKVCGISAGWLVTIYVLMNLCILLTTVHMLICMYVCVIK